MGRRLDGGCLKEEPKNNRSDVARTDVFESFLSMTMIISPIIVLAIANCAVLYWKLRPF